MTGSAFKAMDVVVGCLSYEKGGGLEEGGQKIGPDRRPADFFSDFFSGFSSVFFEVVFRGCFVTSFCDLCRFGGPREGHFWGLFVKSL